MVKRTIRLLVLLCLFPVLAAGADIGDYTVDKKGTGKPVSAFRYFKTIADEGKGIAVITSFLYPGSDPFEFPELYPGKMSFKKILDRFCRLFPTYRYMINGEIVNIHPAKNEAKVLGNGKLLTPDRWITEGAALVQEKKTGVWEPVPGHSTNDFRIPLFREKGVSSKNAAATFCKFFTQYEYTTRKEKIYIYPKGEWPRVAKKYNEPLHVAPSGFNVMVGRGAIIQGGYLFRFGRLMLEPKFGITLVDHKDPDQGPAFLFSANAAWNLIYQEQVRWYCGLALLTLIDTKNDASGARLAFLTGMEYRSLFGEVTLVLHKDEFEPRIGAGWRF